MCLFLYQQLQSSTAQPAVSWCQVNDQKTPGHPPPAHIYILPAPLCSPFLCYVQLTPSVPSKTDPTSWPKPKFSLLSCSSIRVFPCSAPSWHTPLQLSYLCWLFTNVDQGLQTLNTCVRFSHGSLIIGKLQYTYGENGRSTPADAWKDIFLNLSFML